MRLDLKAAAIQALGAHYSRGCWVCLFTLRTFLLSMFAVFDMRINCCDCCTVKLCGKAMTA